MSLILVSLCGLILCVSQHKHLLVHLTCHSIIKTKQEPFTGAAGGGDEAWPLLEQRSTRCVPQLRVGKEKSWRRVREGGGGAPGVGGRELGGGGENLAPRWWSLLTAPMRTMGGAARAAGRVVRATHLSREEGKGRDR